MHGTVLSPIFFGAVAFILICERLMPADPKQSSWSTGFLQDGVWVALTLIFQGSVVVLYANTITMLYKNHLSFLIWDSAKYFPESMRFILGVLAGDFLAWFQHWLKHKVPWFWEMHAVHHSQRQMNLFTDYRFHFMEYIISKPIVLIPLMALGVDTSTVAWWALLTTWQARFYHANIRSNLGFLKFIFVTPQSHRVHHSIEVRHCDMNFGVIFSFWDRLFRTQYAGFEEYPDTGIRDRQFPLEKKADPISLVMVPLQQLIYPFQAIARKRAPDTNRDPDAQS